MLPAAVIRLKERQLTTWKARAIWLPAFWPDDCPGRKFSCR